MAQCKGCNAEIVWAKSPVSGNIMPLQKVPAYFIGQGGYTEKAERRTVFSDEVDPVYISHFLTCPKANEFSRKSKKKVARCSSSV